MIEFPLRRARNRTQRSSPAKREAVCAGNAGFWKPSAGVDGKNPPTRTVTGSVRWLAYFLRTVFSTPYSEIFYAEEIHRRPKPAIPPRGIRPHPGKLRAGKRGSRRCT